MKKLSLFGLIWQSLICLLLLGFTSPLFAAPKLKVTPCKILNKKICVRKNKIPKTLQSVIPEDVGIITPLLKAVITSGDFSEFPDNDEGKTGIKVPAGVKTTTVCRITPAGQLDCTLLTAFNECPGSIVLFDEGTKASYECDLDCSRMTSSKPDSEGNCDCDIVYSSCDRLG